MSTPRVRSGRGDSLFARGKRWRLVVFVLALWMLVISPLVISQTSADQAEFDSRAREVTGLVVEAPDGEAPVVVYTVDGREHTARVGMVADRGDEVLLRYDPLDPEEVVDATDSTPVVAGFVVVVVIAGLVVVTLLVVFTRELLGRRGR